VLQTFCLALLIAAAVTLSAVDKLEDAASEQNEEYENADSYKGAAGWLVFLAVASMIFHGIMIFIRILYFNSSIENYFSAYAFMVSVLCMQV